MIRLCLALILFATGALAGTPATNVRAVDGDTLHVRTEIFPSVYYEGLVRIRGIDSAELKGKCAAEIAKAKEAKAQLSALVAKGVTLENVGRDKFGRLLARVVTVDGQDIAARMIGMGLARAYDGRGARGSWC